VGCGFMSSKRKQAIENQISIYDMVLKTGDKLFKDGALYGEIAGESELLYFVIKTNSRDNMPIPYQKHSLKNNILLGKLTLESFNYD
jgi:hypothetical protein